MRKGFAPDPPIPAIERLTQALAATDSRAATLFTLHAAVEHELDLFLEHYLPGKRFLHDVGFSQKTGIWLACLNLPEELVVRLRKVIVTFNDLRNAFAHRRRPGEIDRILEKLINSLEFEINGEAGTELLVALTAQMLGLLHAAVELDSSEPEYHED